MKFSEPIDVLVELDTYEAMIYIYSQLHCAHWWPSAERCTVWTSVDCRHSEGWLPCLDPVYFLLISNMSLEWLMACCLTAPSHYLKQYWLIINKFLWYSNGNIIMRRSEDLKTTFSELNPDLPGANELKEGLSVTNLIWFWWLGGCQSLLSCDIHWSCCYCMLEIQPVALW